MDQKSNATRFALGTAQFGMDYGVSNPAGRVSAPDAAQIVARAAERGMGWIDTAIAYGDSEQTLGRIGISAWHVMSKLPAFAADTPDLRAWARGQVQASLTRLGAGALDALLLHAPQQLLQPRGDELYQALRTLREEGLVKRIGVSIYSPSLLEDLRKFEFGIVQAPFNVFDRRLQTSGWAQRLADDGVEIHLRSIFLQGLLLMEPAQRPQYFSKWGAMWDAWDSWLRASGLTPLQGCVRHAAAQSFASRIVIGVTSVRELDEILAAAEGPLPPLPASLACDDPFLVEPSRWKT